MKKYHIYYLTIFIFMIMSLAIFIFSILTIPNKTRCSNEKVALNLKITNGLIINKYRDSINHNFETIEFKIGNNKEKTNVFVGDFSDCFDFLMVGDLINKEKNDLEIRISRSEVNTTFVLNFDCQR